MIITIVLILYITFAVGTFHGLYYCYYTETVWQKATAVGIAALWPFTYTYRFAYRLAHG